MAGMRFEYDEAGSTYYFVLSVLGLILVPATIFGWPRAVKRDQPKQRECGCDNCQMKRTKLKRREPTREFRRKMVRLVLILGWLLLFFVVYKASTVEVEVVEFDPWSVLGLDKDATKAEVRKAFRELSQVYHPDKGGDQKTFIMITKAKDALTNDESRQRWEEFGDPDGPGVTRVGIALPKWLIDEKNSWIVLGLYGALFGIVLPCAVGTWWYKSIKFSSDKILLVTQQLYFHQLHRTTGMNINRALLILGASLEFSKFYNSEVVERPSDNEEVPKLFKQIPNFDTKSRQPPLSYPYSLKARALIYSHLHRLPLTASLDEDKEFVLKKCPFLIQEMVNIISQMISMFYAKHLKSLPKLSMVENTIKCSQLIVQALPENRNPLLQLPHVREDMLKHFNTKKRRVKTIKELAQLDESDRRALFQRLTDNEYQDVLTVLGMMPLVTADAKLEVRGERDNTITAESIVTVVVTLRRESILNVAAVTNSDIARNGAVPQAECDVAAGAADDDSNSVSTEQTAEPVTEWKKSPTITPWKQKKKTKKGGSKKSTSKATKKVQAKAKKTLAVPSANGNNEADNASDLENDAADGGDRQRPTDEPSRDEMNRDEQNSDEQNSDDESGESDEDAEWMRFQQEMKKENSLETKSKESFPVHCPYFPVERQESWWVFLADRKNTLSLYSPPVLVSNLKTEEEVQLRFSAPNTSGWHQLSVGVKSDSYIGFDDFFPFKFQVHPKSKISEAEMAKHYADISDDEDRASSDADSHSKTPRLKASKSDRRHQHHHDHSDEDDDDDGEYSDYSDS